MAIYWWTFLVLFIFLSLSSALVVSVQNVEGLPSIKNPEYEAPPILIRHTRQARNFYSLAQAFSAARILTGQSVNGYNQCGQEGFAPSQIGGELVSRGRYPWLGALYKGRTKLTYRCVVSLISRRTVITAAHCIFNHYPESLWVYLGRHDLFENPEGGAELVGVSGVHTPPRYNGNPLPDSDLGLLILSNPVVYTRYIQPLCLWNPELRVSRDEGDSGAVAGWGYDSTAQKTRFPKTVSVDLVSREECLKKMDRANDFITDRTVCAGNSEAHGPCLGDSGAALIVQQDDRWVIRGVVSLSPRQGHICDLSQYAIYCDVTKYGDWIRDNMVD